MSEGHPEQFIVTAAGGERRLSTMKAAVGHVPPSILLTELVEATQQNGTGSIKLKLFKGTCVAVGRKSPHSMYKKELATYGAEDQFDQKLAEGFIKIWGMPYKRS